MRNHSNRLFKRLMMALAGIIIAFGLTGCTKSFCTNQDKSNQLFAYYGDLYQEKILIDENHEDSFDYAASTEAEKTSRAKLIEAQNTHRTTLFSAVANGSYSTTWFELKTDDGSVDFLSYMSGKAVQFKEDNYALWQNGTLGKIEDVEQAKAVAWHVGIYAGLNYDENGTVTSVANLWTNMNAWYDLAVAELGVLRCPSSTYLASIQQNCAAAYSANTACITPDSMSFLQGNAKVYIEGKTWGQAFKEYGFLEGLFVYPLAWIVHAIVEALGDTGWIQILAIFVVTILVRLITIISTLVQNKSTTKQQKIQPLLNELAKKYPNSEVDKEQRNAMAMEQAQLMKKYKIHPFLPILFMIIQFPLFICIWSALQGSAALAAGNFYGLPLTTRVSECFTTKGLEGKWVGIVIFILMSVANALSSMTGLWFNTWKSKNFNNTGIQKKDENGNVVDPNKTMKIMNIVMMVFVIFMGWSLPVGMGIYWLIGALMSIVQTLLMEALAMRSRHNDMKNTGDGSSLAAIRRSSRHIGQDNKQKKQKKSADKPLWR